MERKKEKEVRCLQTGCISNVNVEGIKMEGPGNFQLFSQVSFAITELNISVWEILQS